MTFTAYFFMYIFFVSCYYQVCSGVIYIVIQVLFSSFSIQEHNSLKVIQACLNFVSLQLIQDELSKM